MISWLGKMIEMSSRLFEWGFSSEFILGFRIFFFTARTGSIFIYKSRKNCLLFHGWSSLWWFDNSTPTYYISMSKLLLNVLLLSSTTWLSRLGSLSWSGIVIKGELHSCVTLRERLLMLLIRVLLNLKIEIWSLRLLTTHYIGNIS